MGPPKMFRWISTRYGSRRSSSPKVASSSRTEITTGRRVTTKQKKALDDDKRHANADGTKGTFSDLLPVRFGRQCQRSLLARRGIHQSKRNVLTFQPNKRPNVKPIIDADFFNDTPAAGTTVMLESFSPATPVSSLDPGQARAMLEMLSLGRFGESEETPVCESTPGMMTSEEAGLSVEARGSGLKKVRERSDPDVFVKHGGFNQSSPSSSAECSPDRSGFFNDAAVSDILRLEDLSKISLSKMFPMMELHTPVAQIDKICDSGNYPLENRKKGHASITGSRLHTVDGSPHALPPEHSQSSEAKVWDARKIQGEDEDTFLFLAWTSMPAQARSSKPQPRHKVSVKPCAMPLPHPKIAAAEARISAFESSPKARQLDKDLRKISASEGADKHMPDDVWQAGQRIAEASTVVEFRAFLKDLVFVQMYVDEMKMRCTIGVWWEGWLIIEELRDRGVVGSDLEGS